jgi:hypothetical protein
MTGFLRRAIRPSLLVALALVAVAALSQPSTRGVDPPAPASAASPVLACTAVAHARLVGVADGDELEEALEEARAGDLIVAATGEYRGDFELAADGGPGRRIVLCGEGEMTIDGGGMDGGYGLHITGEYWSVRGVRIRNVNKGVILDGARYADLSDLEIFELGQEGVHFRTHSTDNVLRDSWIHDTGKLVPEFGEGVYVGSAESNWCEYTDCEPDLSHRNEIIRNRIGPGVTAESIDVKEGTEDGVIRHNSFDGTGMSAAQSWVDIKGNGYRISQNQGRNSALHGFRVNLKVGYGHDAVFSGNFAEVGAEGYGFLVDEESVGVQVLCDNEVRDAGAGWGNVPCVEEASGTNSLGPA